MREWKCESCHHEGLGRSLECDWCGGKTETLRETHKIPWDKLVAYLKPKPAK